MKLKYSIKTKVILFTCVLLLFLSLCQVLFGIFFAKRTFVSKQKEQIKALFLSIKQNYSDDPDALYNLTSQAQGLHSIQIEISSSKERIYINRNVPLQQKNEAFKLPYSKNDYSENPSVYIYSPGVRRSATSKPGEKQTTAQTPDHGVFRLTGCFDYNGEKRYVTLSSPMEPIDLSVSIVTQNNAVIAFCILLLGCVAAYFFAGNLAKPVREVEAVAKNVAELSFDKTASEDVSTKELYSLSVSVNSMANKLNDLITELESANKQLQADVEYQRQLETMRRVFIANVSHEMKTPLCMLIMYSENLKNNIDGIDRDYYCSTIIEEAERLNSMVKQLLDLSAIENGLSHISLSPLDMSALCARLIERTAVLLKPFRVETEIQDGLNVSGDENYLEQAASNFITNAVSHSPEGAVIKVRLTGDSGNAVFSVYNQGSHIAEYDLPHVWESFYQTDKSRTQTEDMHIGLGLYIVKTIVEAHHGSCNAQNEADGVRFSFSIPITNEALEE